MTPGVVFLFCSNLSWGVEHVYYVYILASRRNGTLYVGVTNSLSRRVWEHKEGKGGAFTKKYGVDRLVYYERYDYVHTAIDREKRLKRWLRKWKLALIEERNPQWLDRYETLHQ